MKKFLGLMLVFALVMAFAPAYQPTAVTQAQEKVTLTIESWRNDDLEIWQDVIIPAFNAHYPDIEVIFAPTAPTEYNAALNAKLEGGTAGDLITCRPFDQSPAARSISRLICSNRTIWYHSTTCPAWSILATWPAARGSPTTAPTFSAYQWLR